jgi:hypothetical protein
MFPIRMYSTEPTTQWLITDLSSYQVSIVNFT